MVEEEKTDLDRVIWSRSCIGRQRVPRHRRSRLSWVLWWSIRLEIPQLNVLRPFMVIPLITVVRGWCLAELIQPLLGPCPAPGSPSISRAPPALSVGAAVWCVGVLRPLAVLDGCHAATSTAAVEHRGDEDGNDDDNKWENGICKRLVGQRPGTLFIRHDGGREAANATIVCPRLGFLVGVEVGGLSLIAGVES